jgi:hypothetical protein
MTLRSVFASRKRAVPALAVVAVMAWIGYAVACGDPSATPDAKAKHLPIAGLRDRMLENYHGQATDIFTAIPGFGMERMPSLYKYVPFEVPDLSTNEVEVEKQIVPPKLLTDVFAKSLDDFRDPTKPLPPVKKKAPMFDAGAGFSSSFGGTVTTGLQLRLLDLVGLTDADGPRVYSGGKAFEAVRMSAEEVKAERAKNPKLGFYIPPPKRPARAQDKEKVASAKLEMRPLDLFEIAGVAELQQGKDLFVRHKGSAIRMLGALRATDVCLQCHADSKKGDLLGAFSYTFVDTNKMLEEKIKGPSAK